MAIPANRCEAAASGAERETDLDVDDLYNLGERLGASRTLERIPPACGVIDGAVKGFAARRSQLQDLPIDLPGGAPPAIDERRIEIDAGRAGPEHGDHVRAAADAAVSLDGNAATRDVRRALDIGKRTLEDRAAVEGALPGAGLRVPAPPAPRA